MNVITLKFAASPFSNDHEVRPVIDGIDLLRELAEDCLGLDPPQLFQQPALGRNGVLLIGRCSCGDVGCGAFRAEVAVAGERVSWRVGDDHSFTFDKQQYLECFERASQDTTWESVGRTAERLVSSIDLARLSEYGYRFEWTSTRIMQARVTLCFVKEGKQRLFQVEWDDRHAEDAEQQVRLWAAEYGENAV
jgi:hypothetical protein